ncbi:diaminopimelate epimerase [bacterium]|nr:diaminopimelate epimerase [bacterium]
MRFTKMHGLGNDYVYVNLFEERVENPAQVAIAVSDRHFGIGADGLILICPTEVADARMRMFNADGSESEMCGNGVRCVAKYVYDHGIATKPELTIETGRGVLTLQMFPDAQGKAAKVRVNMGTPILPAGEIPTTFTTDRVIDAPLMTDVATQFAKEFETTGVDARLTGVSMGNPHIVIYCRDVAALPLETIGPVLEHHAAFPRRINVHFVQIHSPNEVTMRTWERGSGITLACGTGACSVAVAGVLTQRTNEILLAHLPGGDLELEWSGRETDPVYMTGPATEVFTGDWPL